MAPANRRSGPTLAADTFILGRRLSDLSVRTRFPELDRVEPGRLQDWARVAERDALKLLPEVARLVADLPRGGNHDVVWVSGTNELLVHTDRSTASFAAGLVTVGLAVACDQTGEVTVSVPLGVGTEKELRGLYMSAFSSPVGPPEITDVWSEALTAYAWECVLELAREVAAASGHDRQGRPLVPAAVSASAGFLLVKATARGTAKEG